MELFLLTIAVAVASAWLMFKVYHVALVGILKHWNLNLEELKAVEATPTVKMWNQVLETAVMLAILCKFFFT